ncbi:Crp/Fnr family transcriptional regulator [Aestuariicella sp. G3-2]|uniref:Crp/Fnr family transcriptional regulator n=1 Tax=Pseudomaricurvus albidus TaxID=2842452 RepID=UPI001C0B680A|nr:Crp/Fnr family transcriptional regulator [Aestuariicella albida]MBU3068948.1 Crp/Fnr family transcriptional regulator [Aestuariicella albida]
MTRFSALPDKISDYPIHSSEQWVYYLPEELQPEVIGAMEIQNFRRHDTIYSHHSPTNEIYTVIQGNVRLSNSALSGKDIAISTMPRGCTFGELSFVDELPRQNIATASTDCTLAVLNRKQYNVLCREHPAIISSMLQFLSHRLRSLVNIHQDSTSLELPQQLAKRLLFMAKNQSRTQSAQCEIDVSQDELAATLGVSRQHVNKALKRWQAAGLIDVGYRKVILLDQDALSEASDS